MASTAITPPATPISLQTSLRPGCRQRAAAGLCPHARPFHRTIKAARRALGYDDHRRSGRTLDGAPHRGRGRIAPSRNWRRPGAGHQFRQQWRPRTDQNRHGAARHERARRSASASRSGGPAADAVRLQREPWPDLEPHDLIQVHCSPGAIMITSRYPRPAPVDAAPVERCRGMRLRWHVLVRARAVPGHGLPCGSLFPRPARAHHPR